MDARCPFVFKNGRKCNKELAKDEFGNLNGFCNKHSISSDVSVVEKQSIEDAKMILAGKDLSKTSSFSEEAWSKINYYEKYHETDRAKLDDLADVIIFMQGHLNYIFEHLDEDKVIRSGKWLNEALRNLADVKEKFAYIKWNKENLICSADLKEFLVHLVSVLAREIQDKDTLDRIYKAMKLFMSEKFSERKGFNV